MPDPRHEFSEWLHTELVTEFAHESESWATERVQRVMDHLNDFRPGMYVLAILENLALDAGNVAGVYGPENLLDPTDPKRDSVSFHVQEWLWTHLHGYHPLHERVARARALARALGDGTVAA